MQGDVGINFWLTQWNWNPTIIVGTLAIVSLYLYAVGPLRTKYFPTAEVKMSQMVTFLLGMFTIFISLFSPLDKLGDTYLFSAHMVQHLMLTIVGPPLLVLGTPAWLVEPMLHHRIFLALARFLTFPVIAFFLFNANFWLWHAPPLYDATLVNELLHVVEHLTYIVLGVLYWWPIFSPLQRGLPRLSPGGSILYLFLGGMPTVLLGAGLTFMQPLYAPYIYAPRVWGISPATDQQLGGLIMWVPGNILMIVIASFLFIRWMQTQDARQRAEEARMYAQEDTLDEEDEVYEDETHTVEHLS